MKQIALTWTVLLLSVALGCQPRFVADTYSVIEITDRVTGSPVAGAEVQLASVLFKSWEEENDSSDAIRVAPTGEFGRTLIPLSRAGDAPFDVVLHLTVELGERRETFQLDNDDDASVTGNEFIIRVLDTQAPPPEPPVLRVVEGSDPVLIEVEGYVRTLGVCSNAEPRVIWRVSSINGQYYLDSVAVGSIPDGFEDTSLRHVFAEGISTVQASSCPVWVYGDEFPDEGFTAFAFPLFPSEYIRSESYCIDDAGAAISCNAVEQGKQDVDPYNECDDTNQTHLDWKVRLPNNGNSCS